MVQPRYVIRNPSNIDDEDAINDSIHVIRTKDGAHFLAVPFPEVDCVKKDRQPTSLEVLGRQLDAIKEKGYEQLRRETGRRLHAPNGPNKRNRKPKDTTDFDEAGHPVLWGQDGEPEVDGDGFRIYLDSTGKRVVKGVTRDDKGKPVAPYAEGFIWKQGRDLKSGLMSKEEDKIYCRDIYMQQTAKAQNMALTTAILNSSAVTLSRILNHPNIVSIVDIVDNSRLDGELFNGGLYQKFTVWEDLDAGCLADQLPQKLPDPSDHGGWTRLTEYNPHRFSLPEALCWHVLHSISRALVWLHFGVKETAGIPDDWNSHDDDWMPILIRDISPEQIFFNHPKGTETFGECKLGGFRYAKICATKLVPITSRVIELDANRQLYWPPEIYNNLQSWDRTSEIWALGAVIYTMMTGIPPPPTTSYYNWTISRMNDKGYSQGIRDIVADMLNDDKHHRPQAQLVVSRVEEGMRNWRVQTRDGREYKDIRDADHEYRGNRLLLQR